VRRQPSIRDTPWSDSFFDLINQMLRLKQDRIKLVDILNHAWLKDAKPVKELK